MVTTLLLDGSIARLKHSPTASVVIACLQHSQSYTTLKQEVSYENVIRCAWKQPITLFSHMLEHKHVIECTVKHMISISML